MNNHTNLERVVGLIHQSFKDNENIKIFTNHKLRVPGGRLREFDIIIRTMINNIEIAVAIECKDYKRPVSVDKIEAFHSKCSQFNEISKKVFVSSNGYQSGSKETGKRLGVELYTLETIGTQLINNMIDLIRIDRQIRINSNISIGVNCTKSELSKVDVSEDLVIYFKDKNEHPISVYGFLWNNVVVKHQQEITGIMYQNFMKKGCRTNNKLTIPFKLETYNVFIKGKNGRNYPVDIINAVLICWFDEIPTTVSSARSYHRTKNKSEAKVFSVESEISKFYIIYTDNKEIPTIFVEKDGNYTQLKILATFDQEKDDFEIATQ